MPSALSHTHAHTHRAPLKSPRLPYCTQSQFHYLLQVPTNKYLHPMSAVSPHTVTTHLPYSRFHQFKKHPLRFSPQPPTTLWSQPPCLGSSRIRDCPGILLDRNRLLARAEDKARDGSSSTSSTQHQTNSDKQNQVIMFISQLIYSYEEITLWDSSVRLYVVWPCRKKLKLVSFFTSVNLKWFFCKPRYLKNSN